MLVTYKFKTEFYLCMVEYMETACELREDIVMHPFAFRTHAHTHGKLHRCNIMIVLSLLQLNTCKRKSWRSIVDDLGEVTAGYRIREGKWTEIGRMSPHKPQVGQLAQGN